MVLLTEVHDACLNQNDAWHVLMFLGLLLLMFDTSMSGPRSIDLTSWGAEQLNITRLNELRNPDKHCWIGICNS